MRFEFNGRSFSFFAEPRQWYKLLLLTREYLLCWPVLLCFGLLAAAAFVYRRAAKKGATNWQEGLRAWFPLLYLLFILSLSLFNRSSGPAGNFHFAFDYVLAGGGAYHESRVLLALLDGLYYIPFGMLLRWHRGRWTLYQAAVLVLSSGFLVEALQAVTGRGTGSVEHWLMYTLGGWFGMALMAALRRRREDKRLTRAVLQGGAR